MKMYHDKNCTLIQEDDIIESERYGVAKRVRKYVHPDSKQEELVIDSTDVDEPFVPGYEGYLPLYAVMNPNDWVVRYHPENMTCNGDSCDITHLLK